MDMKRIETLYQLVARLQKVKEASRRDLEDYLDKRGYPVSSRTFDRCLHDIRTFMRLEVSYNPRTRTYSLPPKMEAETEARLSFLENYMILKLVDDLSEDSANILKWILPEQPLDLPWLDNMYAIAAALQQKRQLQFQHRNFGDGILRSYVVHTYFLRQYRKRWYLVAMPEGQDTLLVFGIDRMSGAEVLPQASVRRGKATVHDFFRHMIGVSDATMQPVAIRIRVPFSTITSNLCRCMPRRRCWRRILTM